MKTQMFWDMGFVAIPTQVIPPVLTEQENMDFQYVSSLLPFLQKEMLGITKFICYLLAFPMTCHKENK